jgi:sugar lactone lactonase YvrE
MRRWFLAAAIVIAAAATAYSQAQIQAGYAVLTGNVGTAAPVASALFTFSNSAGIIVSQAGVGSAPPILRSRVFVDEKGTRTGLAMANTSAQVATVNLTLRDTAGAVAGQSSLTLNPSEHRSRFVDELFGTLPPNFTGSVTFESNQALSSITLRERKNSFNEPLYATLPVVDLNAPGGTQLVFPHLAAGEGYVTQLILVNRGPQAASGTVRFFASDGTAMVLRANSSDASQLSYTIAPDGVYQVELNSPSGVKIGYATLTAATGSTAPAGTIVFRFVKDDTVVTEAAVAAVRATTLSRIYVDYIGSRTGFAIANSSQQAANVTFRLLDRYGVEESTTTLSLAAGAHTAKFADELFPNVADGFTGLMEIQSPVAIAPVTLKLHVNSRFDQILTTLPVADLTLPASSAPVILPQIAIGQGFSTRLIFLHPGSVSDANGQMRFVQSDGTPMSVPMSGTTADNFGYQLPVGNGRQFYPGSAATVASVSLLDSATGQPTTELLLTEGAAFRPRLRVVDTAGIVRDDFEPTFQSSNQAIATVDSLGRLRGVKAGFSTIVINVSGVIATAAATVTKVESGISGYNVLGVAQDLAKRLYLVVPQDHTVLRADDLSQAPVIYAGIQRSPGLKNDLKLQSQFRQPSFVALDATEGSLYLADSANNVIRRIRPGTSDPVETLAGTGVAGSQDGPAAQASFNNPRGVALDGNGYLWIADSNNQTIRRLNILTMTVDTVAGKVGTPGNADGVGNAALFRNPSGVAVVTETADEQLARELRGDPPPPVEVVVADTGNNTVRSVDATGKVTTFAVTTSSSLRFELRGGLASRISLANADTATLNGPTGVAITASGDIVITESGRRRVTALVRNGSRSRDTVAVSLTSPNTDSVPQTVLLGSGGDIIIGGTNSVQIVQQGVPTITAITPDHVSATGGQSVTITGTNFDANARVLIAGDLRRAVVLDSQTIRLLSPVLPSGTTTVTITTRGGNASRSVVVDPPSSSTPGFVTTAVGGGASFGDGAAPTSATLVAPSGLALGPGGIVYSVERLYNRVRRIDRVRGIITTVAGTGEEGFSGDGRGAGAARLSNPVAAAVDSGGNLFITDTRNNRIRRVDALTGIITTVAGTGTRGFAGDNGPARLAVLHWPDGITVDANDNLLIADSGNQRVRKVDVRTGIITTVAGNGVAGFSGDRGPAINAALNFTPASQVRGLAVDRSGNLLISDTGNNRIRAVDRNGIIFTLVGGGPSQTPLGQAGPAINLSSPSGIFAERDGGILIADTGTHTVRRFDPLSGGITAVAGNGTRGFAGDSQLATTARLNFPNAVAADSSGNILISDQFNYRIRQVSARNQIISTIVGSGDQLFVGNGKLSTDASLGTVDGVAVDSRGNMFFADRVTQRIRRVDGVTGTITTIAGDGSLGFGGTTTLAVDSAVNDPAAVALDSAGNVYFADRGNQRIRRIDAASGAITTVAGSGKTGFAGDNGPAVNADIDLKGSFNRVEIAFDAAGNLYFTDTGNNRIRRVDSVTKNITTVAGNGQEGFSGDSGPALSAALHEPAGLAIDGGGNIFIADALNHRVRRVDAASKVITTWAGSGPAGLGQGDFGGDDQLATAARLNVPLGLAFDAAGNLFIADAVNSRVRRVNGTTLIITTVAGTGVSGFSGDGGKAVDARFNVPSGLAVDAAGNLYVADTQNRRIRFVRGPVP